MTSAPIRHLGCPSCGATLARRAEARTVRCRACGNRSVLVGVHPDPRFQAIPQIDRNAAMSIVRKVLAQWPVREGAADGAAFVAADLFWVPFYEFETLQGGTVRQSRGVTYSRGGRVDWSAGHRRFLDPAGNEIAEADYYRQRATEKIDTNVVLRSHRAAGPAGGPDEWGLAAIDVARLRDLEGVRIVPFGSPEAPRGHVLPPRRGRAEAEEDVRRIAGHAARACMDTFASDLSYVYVPVWVVRLRVERHPYTFVVDATRGTLLTGRAPEAPRRGWMFVVCAAAYLGFPIGKIAAIAASGGARDAGGVLGAVAEVCVRVPLFALVVPVLLLFPLAFAWGEFRFRGEVVFGPDGARVEKLSRPARTSLERIIDWMLERIDDMVRAHAEGR